MLPLHQSADIYFIKISSLFFFISFFASSLSLSLFLPFFEQGEIQVFLCFNQKEKDNKYPTLLLTSPIKD